MPKKLAHWDWCLVSYTGMHKTCAKFILVNSAVEIMLIT